MARHKKSHLLFAIPQLILILGFIALSAAGNLHSQLLSYGEKNWQDYASLRHEQSAPTCLEDLKALTETEATPNADVKTDDEDDLDIDDLFDDEDEDESISAEAIAAAKAQCDQAIAAYEDNQKRRQDSKLKAFMAFEKGVSAVVHASTEYGRHFLVLLFAFCALIATLTRSHLALRSNNTSRGDRINQLTQLIANLVLAGSFTYFYHELAMTGLGETPKLPLLWAGTFGTLALANAILLLKPKGDCKIKPKLSHVAAAIPLYVYMAFIAAIYFAGIERHFSGLAIFISLLTEHAILYINVALYVFAGMMLKNSKLADKTFAILRPWKMSPEMLVFIVVAVSALPTAYSGASGIFVIAAGAIIYKELRSAGVRDSLAQASTAMSGSMGMVLNPSLLVVIVAALNKDVTTDQLFGAGLWVFLVNIVIFAIVIFIIKKHKLTIESPQNALKPSLNAGAKLVPYIAIGTAIVLLFHFALATPFDAYSAPIQLPFILLAILIYESIITTLNNNKNNNIATSETSEEQPDKTDDLDQAIEVKNDASPLTLWQKLVDASRSTSLNAGALLTLMALSICLGGIIERANISALLPQSFSSPFLIMLLLFFLLVFIGMIMDPYGAVILVSASLAQLAYSNGIHPVHFWLTVLTAFELGYLTPPVALNHLLTRQIIEDIGALEEKTKLYSKHEDKMVSGDTLNANADVGKKLTFYQRHERILFPIAVKATVLIIVAFGPLIFLY